MLRHVTIIARRELAEALRSRWVLLCGGLFALLAMALATAGMASVGLRGVAGFSRTAISLLNLVLYLVPLLALLLSITSMAAEREEGGLEVLLAQPIARRALVLGKFAGLGAALAIALLGGFGAAGLLIAIAGADMAAGGYLLLVLRSLGLGLAFISMGLWLASASASRLRALTWGLLLWFASVLLYDLLVVGATALFGGAALKGALGLLLVANPVDLTRIAVLIQLGGVDSFGLTAQALIGFLRGPAGSALLALALLAWIVAPLLGAVRAFDRRDFAA
jgi:ABC-type transport system involved in multi-copper enzyme maturation permease subunit